MSFLFALLFLYALPTLAQNMYDKELEVSQKTIERTITSVKRLYAQDSLFLVRFEASEKAFVAMQNANLEMLFPSGDDENPTSLYGSVYRDCVVLERIAMNKARVKFLRRWLEGTGENDVCAGSIKAKSELQSSTKKKSRK